MYVLMWGLGPRLLLNALLCTSIYSDTPSCNKDSDCFPPGFSITSAIPTSLVDCLNNGVCTCSQCFTHNTTTNKCFIEYPTCYYYDPNTDTCVDMRKSQLTALLLSLTLSGVGAANYYIGQNVLAGTQLALLLLVIVGVAGGLGLFYCSISKLEFKQEKNMVTDVGLVVIIYFKFYLFRNRLFLLAQWWALGLLHF